MRYLAKRMLQAILVLWAAFTLVFVLLHAMPGDAIMIRFVGGDLSLSPVFWPAIVLVQVFSFRLGWISVIAPGPRERLILPVLAISLPVAAPLAQILIRNIDEIPVRPFVAVARAKGASHRYALLRHVAGNAALPTLSRLNGCILCAPVHARFAAKFSRQPEPVDKLLEGGTGADLPPLWAAVVQAAAALTTTPVSFGAEHIAALRDNGLDDAAITDVIFSAAFFNWANRLMLSLGGATPPA